MLCQKVAALKRTCLILEMHVHSAALYFFVFIASSSCICHPGKKDFYNRVVACLCFNVEDVAVREDAAKVSASNGAATGGKARQQ